MMTMPIASTANAWNTPAPPIQRLRTENLSDQIKAMDCLDAARLLRDLVLDMKDPETLGQEIGRALLLVSTPTRTSFSSPWRPGAPKSIARGEVQDFLHYLRKFVSGIESA